jgi:hypothetical protein
MVSYNRLKSLMERWRQIKGFEDRYSVSDRGRVFSYYSNKILTGNERKHGYIMITLHKNRKRFKKLIHRLVAKNFIPNPEGLPVAHHIDEDKLNNKVSNLQWVTHQYNNEFSQAKHYVLYDKDDNKVEIFNIMKFARENNLSKSSLNSVARGEINSYMGYTRKPGTKLTRNKPFKLMSPEGEVVKFLNQPEAANFIESHKQRISKLLKGRVKAVNGWTLP